MKNNNNNLKKKLGNCSFPSKGLALNCCFQESVNVIHCTLWKKVQGWRVELLSIPQLVHPHTIRILVIIYNLIFLTFRYDEISSFKSPAHVESIYETFIKLYRSCKKLVGWGYIQASENSVKICIKNNDTNRSQQKDSPMILLMFLPWGDWHTGTSLYVVWYTEHVTIYISLGKIAKPLKMMLQFFDKHFHSKQHILR